jgi:hypothetical protein
MLDEFCEDFHYERKYAIKLLSDALPAAGGHGPPGPEPQYTGIEPIVREIWFGWPSNRAASAWRPFCGNGCRIMSDGMAKSPTASAPCCGTSAGRPWIAC